MSYPEQEEPVVAGESPATPVEETEPEDEPEPDPDPPSPRSTEDEQADSRFDSPEFPAFDEPRHDLDLAVVEPDYGFALDLGDDEENGSE